MPNYFRGSLLSFAAVLFVAASWLLLIQVFRPVLPFFPPDAAAAQTMASQRKDASLVARIGFFCGELWTDYALTIGPIYGGLTNTPPLSMLLEDARGAAVRGARLAPFDGRAWLLIAAVNSQLHDHDPSGALKMSFYAGPNELALMPLRLQIATRSNAIIDPEIQVLLGAEIRKIIASAPALKTDIVAAYRDAPPEARRFIETEVSESDPKLLGSLRAKP